MTRPMVGKQVLEVGLERLVSCTILEGKEGLRNVSEVLSAVLEEVTGQKGSLFHGPRTVDNPGSALDTFEHTIKLGGITGVRELTRKWTMADYCDILREALSRY